MRSSRQPLQPARRRRKETTATARSLLEAVTASEPRLTHNREPDADTLAWKLGLGAFGLAWSLTTVTTYVPPLLERYTSSSTLIGLVLASEALVALTVPLVVGAASDGAETPLRRRRELMLLAVAPIAITLVVLGFVPGVAAIAATIVAFFVAYYVYEPPYRGIYPDLLEPSDFSRSQGIQNVLRGMAIAGALIGGGLVLDVWRPGVFLVAAVVGSAACAAVVYLVPDRRHTESGRQRPFVDELRRTVATARGNRLVRGYLVASVAWEFTFSGMRTFVVLYFVRGLGQPAHTATIVLLVVALGYLLAAWLVTRLPRNMPVGQAIVAASIVYGAGLAAAGMGARWHWWLLAVVFPIAVAGGTVMTLGWALLYRLLGPDDHGVAAGLAVMARGLGIALGPLAVGAAVDLAAPLLRATAGYQVVWPVCGLPILAVLPVVRSLARSEEAADEPVVRLRDRPARPAPPCRCRPSSRSHAAPRRGGAEGAHTRAPWRQ
jgi:predicted MFS family arabinose efflux permease